MCKEVQEEQIRLLEETEDPNELRKLLDEIGECTGCSCGRSSEPREPDVQCTLQHQIRFRNWLLHTFKKIGF